MNMKKIIMIMAALLISVSAGAIQLGELNGSDLGLGVGARAISMAGAFTALGDDASALYWNPAAITEIDHNEAMLMMNVDPVRYSYKALVYRPKSWDKKKTRPTIGISRANRLKFIGDGDWSQGNASHLIDLSMINVPLNYVGGLNSRTNDWRFTYATRIPEHQRLSVGLTYIDFKCVTTFFNTLSGRTCQVVAYKTMDAGFHYRASDTRQFGLTLRNPLESSKPKYLNFGMAWTPEGGDNIYTFDVEYVFGHYGTDLKSVNFLMFRTGMEKDLRNGWKARGGLIIPVRARTSSLGDMYKQIPAPKMDLTLGVGYTHKAHTVDLALFGDPGWGYIQKELKAGMALTYKMAF